MNACGAIILTVAGVLESDTLKEVALAPYRPLGLASGL
jgi:hypothetical protein